MSNLQCHILAYESGCQYPAKHVRTQQYSSYARHLPCSRWNSNISHISHGCNTRTAMSESRVRCWVLVSWRKWKLCASCRSLVIHELDSWVVFCSICKLRGCPLSALWNQRSFLSASGRFASFNALSFARIWDCIRTVVRRVLLRFYLLPLPRFIFQPSEQSRQLPTVKPVKLIPFTLASKS